MSKEKQQMTNFESTAASNVLRRNMQVFVRIKPFTEQEKLMKCSKVEPWVISSGTTI